MKKFRGITIENDSAKILYLDEETGGTLFFEEDLKPYYEYEGRDLGHNVFSSEYYRSDGEELCGEVNGEFLENFICDAVSNIQDELGEKGVVVDSSDFDCSKWGDDYDQGELDEFDAVNHLFNDAIRKALDLNENWEKND
jgi:hypothetical protein